MSILKRLYAKARADRSVVTAKQRFPDNDRTAEYFDLHIQYLKHSGDDTTVLYEHDIGRTIMAEEWDDSVVKLPVVRSD